VGLEHALAVEQAAGRTQASVSQQGRGHQEQAKCLQPAGGLECQAIHEVGEADIVGFACRETEELPPQIREQLKPRSSPAPCKANTPRPHQAPHGLKPYSPPPVRPVARQTPQRRPSQTSLRRSLRLGGHGKTEHGIALRSDAISPETPQQKAPPHADPATPPPTAPHQPGRPPRANRPPVAPRPTPPWRRCT